MIGRCLDTHPARFPTGAKALLFTPEKSSGKQHSGGNRLKNASSTPGKHTGVARKESSHPRRGKNTMFYPKFSTNTGYHRTTACTCRKDTSSSSAQANLV